MLLFLWRAGTLKNCVVPINGVALVVLWLTTRSMDEFSEEDVSDGDDTSNADASHLTKGDQGPSLVSHRVCLTPQHREEHWLCTNIFRSTCTICGRVCTFIIDSGSCRNVIAESATHKLGITCESHPTSYSLTWFQEGVGSRHTGFTTSAGSLFDRSFLQRPHIF